MIFVYVQGMRGPEPQKWSERFCDLNGNPRPVLAVHSLTPAHEWLCSIDDLVRLFPPPPSIDDKSP